MEINYEMSFKEKLIKVLLRTKCAQSTVCASSLPILPRKPKPSHTIVKIMQRDYRTKLPHKAETYDAKPPDKAKYIPHKATARSCAQSPHEVTEPTLWITCGQQMTPNRRFHGFLNCAILWTHFGARCLAGRIGARERRIRWWWRWRRRRSGSAAPHSFCWTLSRRGGRYCIT